MNEFLNHPTALRHILSLKTYERSRRFRAYGMCVCVCVPVIIIHNLHDAQESAAPISRSMPGHSSLRRSCARRVCIICINFYLKTIFLQRAAVAKRKFVLEKVFQVIGSHRRNGEARVNIHRHQRHVKRIFLESKMTTDGHEQQFTET